MPFCKQCGKFGSKTFCSNTCRSRYHGRYYKKKRICIVCGNKLPPRKAKYCCEECRKVKQKEREDFGIAKKRYTYDKLEATSDIDNMTSNYNILTVGNCVFQESKDNHLIEDMFGQNKESENENATMQSNYNIPTVSSNNFAPEDLDGK